MPSASVTSVSGAPVSGTDAKTSTYANSTLEWDSVTPTTLPISSPPPRGARPDELAQQAHRLGRREPRQVRAGHRVADRRQGRRVRVGQQQLPVLGLELGLEGEQGAEP